MINTMRKTGILLSAILLLSLFVPIVASAAGADALAIDTVHRFAGMSKTWSQGYSPAVSGSTVKVVMPLVLNPQSGVASIADDTITVKPNFGDAASSPFVFSNIETKVKLAPHVVNSAGATVQAWLLSFSFALEKRRVNGRYPLLFHVGYTLPDGTAATQDFTVYVTVRNGIDPNATPRPVPTPTPTPPPPAQPRLIVSRYAVDPEAVEAGREFKLEFDIRNTSDTAAVRNIKITVKGEGADLAPAAGSNTLYVKDLAKSGTKTLEFAMKARFDAEPKPQKVTIAIEYEDKNGASYSAADELLVQVTQPMRMEFDRPNLPAEVTAGETVPVSLNVFNMGRSKVQNVLCKVSAPGLIPEGSAFLGNMEAGTGKTAELFVYIGTRDMSLSDGGEIAYDTAVTEKYGDTTGFINVSWEDEFGNRHEKQVVIKSAIKEPAAPPVSAPQEPENPQAGQWWISVAVGAGLITAIVAAMVFIRRRRAKEATGGNEAD